MLHFHQSGSSFVTHISHSLMETFLDGVRFGDAGVVLFRSMGLLVVHHRSEVLRRDESPPEGRSTNQATTRTLLFIPYHGREAAGLNSRKSG